MAPKGKLMIDFQSSETILKLMMGKRPQNMPQTSNCL